MSCCGSPRTPSSARAIPILCKNRNAATTTLLAGHSSIATVETNFCVNSEPFLRFVMPRAAVDAIVKLVSSSQIEGLALQKNRRYDVVVDAWPPLELPDKI
jgi:hypothetical protein